MKLKHCNNDELRERKLSMFPFRYLIYPKVSMVVLEKVKVQQNAILLKLSHMAGLFDWVYHDNDAW